MQHPDEGIIHSWIDGALDAESARDIELHIATCADCARVAAEARGLVAASSRILTSLDNVPGNVLPATTAPAKPIERVRRQWPMPFWMRTAAAVLIVAGVSSLVMTAKLNSPEHKRADMASAPAEMEAVAMIDSAPVSPTTSDLASSPPTAVAQQTADTQPVAARSAQGSGVKPGRPGSRTESERDAAAARQLARTSDEVEQKVSVLAAARPSAADPKIKEESKDIVGSGAGAPVLRDTSRGSDIAALAGPSSAARVAENRPADVFQKRAEATPPSPSPSPSAQQSRRAGIGSVMPGRAPSAASPATANAFGIGAHPAVGCYALSLSPWSGGTIPFGAPPARIELDSLTSIQETMRGSSLVHPARGTASNGAPYAYWTTVGDSLLITWRDEQRGVRMTLPVSGEIVQGTARTFSTSARDGTAQTAAVEARRISCRE